MVNYYILHIFINLKTDPMIKEYLIKFIVFTKKKNMFE